MTTMKAIRLHNYGSPSDLHYEDAPRPTPGPGEALVRVYAAGVNPVDKMLRAGFMKARVPLAFPWIPGRDFSGVVESVGRGVKSVTSGEEVFGMTDIPRGGADAEYVVAPAAHLVKKPRSLDHVHAAAMPLAALTAWQGLFNGGLGLQPGMTVLILGAAGGVGHFAVQLAKWKGARVIGAGRAGEEAAIKKVGADVFVDTADGLEGAGKVDAVLDLVGGDVAQKAWAQLKPGGAFASTRGEPSASEAKAKRARAIALFTQMNPQQLAEIGALADKGAIKAVVSKTLPLADAQQAHELLDGNGATGKLVLTVP